MGKVVVKEVKTYRQRKQFLDFQNKLYKGNPYICPAIYADEKKVLSSKNIYNDQSKSIFFNAYRGKKMVGRIQGILQEASNLKHNEKRVRFTRFDAYDDQEVADALFKAVEEWGKDLGMEVICGPLGYSDLDREGLLIEGFDQLNTYVEQYNYPYYQKLIENNGYQKEVDWLEFKLAPPQIDSDRMMRLSTIMLKRTHLHVATALNKKDFINKYKDKFFDLLDIAYVDLYGTVPFTPKMKKMMVDNFKIMVDMDLCIFILDEKDNLVCFGICFPSITKALQKSMGHLTLPCLYRFKKAMKNPEILDLGLIGVLPQYAKLGISSYILARLLAYLKVHPIKHCETNLNLETNKKILAEWKNFKSEQHKRRRAFYKKLT